MQVKHAPFLFVAWCAVAAASAQEIQHAVFEGYPDSIRARLEIRDEYLKRRAAEAGDAGLEAVVTAGKLWPTGQPITVAFRGGDTDLHAQVAEAANEWTRHADLTFDFGHDDTTNTYRTWSPSDKEFAAQIRISFHFRGYWSLVGTDSSNPFISRPGEPSMNFGGFAEELPTRWSSTVLHEFGHAIGLQHEHQHPQFGCDFRWEDDPAYVPTRDSFGQFIADSEGRRPGIYTVLGGPPNEWSRDTVDHNLRSLPNSSAYISGPFDPDSIMKYYFRAWMFVNGTSSHCFTGAPNDTLSDGDIASIAAAYPHDQEPEALRELAETRQRYEALTAGMAALPQRASSELMPAPDEPTPVMPPEHAAPRIDKPLKERLAAARPSTAALDTVETPEPKALKLAALADQPEPRQELERIIGGVDGFDFLPAAFVVVGAQRQAAVGRIAFKAMYTHPFAGTFYPDDGWGTGFLVAPTILMTNNHVLEQLDFARDKVRVEFNYQRRLRDGILEDSDSYDLDPDDFFYTNAALDFTLVRVKSKSPGSGNPVGTSLQTAGERWGFYSLNDSRQVTEASYFEDMRLNIIQHPAGRPKEVAIHQNHLDRLLPSHIRYTTDTEGGSSGSPVFDNQWILMAIHHRAGEKDSSGNWKNNQGVRMDKIIDDIENSDIPDSAKAELGL